MNIFSILSNLLIKIEDYQVLKIPVTMLIKSEKDREAPFKLER